MANTITLKFVYLDSSTWTLGVIFKNITIYDHKQVSQYTCPTFVFYKLWIIFVNLLFYYVKRSIGICQRLCYIIIIAGVYWKYSWIFSYGNNTFYTFNKNQLGALLHSNKKQAEFPRRTARKAEITYIGIEHGGSFL